MSDYADEIAEAVETWQRRPKPADPKERTAHLADVVRVTLGKRGTVAWVVPGTNILQRRRTGHSEERRVLVLE